MKKTILILICLLMTGCSQKSTVVTEADTDIYKSFYEDLYEQTSFDSSSPYFKTSLEMASAGDGVYAYAVILDEPEMAMYNIRVIVLEGDIPYNESTKMMPSSGILDTACAMIPNQVNKQSGYVKGIALRGSVNESPVEIRLLVEWITENNQMMREYLRWQLSEEGAAAIDE